MDPVAAPTTPTVSVVIVCMNNLANLYPCLKSIAENTAAELEVFVVAYLFTRENLDRVRADFPWVKFVESNEIRGFSENNNLALRQAKGKYCLVINDDTEVRPGAIDRMAEAFDRLPENVAIVSPNIFDGNGNLAVSGNPPMRWYDVPLLLLRLKDRYRGNRWVMQPETFRSYNITGAVFMIKTEIFRNMGFFDEYYFFAPEDIALSTELNRRGYECWVEPSAEVVHYEGMTGGKSLSPVKIATAAAQQKGELHFYADGRWYLYAAMMGIYTLLVPMQLLYHALKSVKSDNPQANRILARANLQQIKAIYSRKSPKELFTRLFNLYYSYPHPAANRN